MKSLAGKIAVFLEGVYDVFVFILHFFGRAFRAPFEWREIGKQCYEIGYKSVAIITLTGFITGIVFTKQSRPSLSEFGATSWLPSLVSLAIVRALAPLITALIVAGKVGSRIGAELGSMRVTEQIDAMEVSSAKPFNFLVARLDRAALNAEQLTAGVKVYAAGLNEPGGLAHELVYDTAVFAELKETIGRLRAVAAKASVIMDTLHRVAAGLDDESRPAGLLLRDKGVADDLHATIRNLRTGSEKLDQDLEALQHNFLLRGFFKKKK